MTSIGMNVTPQVDNVISVSKKVADTTVITVEKKIPVSKNDELAKSSHEKGIPASAIKIAGEITLAVGNGVSHSPKVINHASKLVSAGVPKSVGVLNYAVGVYDSYDLIKKVSDKNVSTLSKAFAAGTVALDVVSIVAHTKGSGKIAMAAGLVSIGTSVLSDKFK